MIKLEFTKEELAHLWNSWDPCYLCIENKKECELCNIITEKIDKACKEAGLDE